MKTAASYLSAAPLLALGYCDRTVPANTPELWAVKSWRRVEHAYRNATCARCDAAKRIASETLWCDACVALPACSECGTPDVDAPACASCAQADNERCEDLGCSECGK